MSRILRSGTSSGFGRAFAAHFLDRGWEVIATMRNPCAEGLPMSDNLRLLPTLSIYSASKAAVNTFTESFALEAADFGGRNRLALPGIAPETSFGRNAVARMGMNVPEAYGHFVQAYFQSLQSATEKTQVRNVAQAVWHTITDENTSARDVIQFCSRISSDQIFWNSSLRDSRHVSVASYTPTYRELSVCGPLPVHAPQWGGALGKIDITARSALSRQLPRRAAQPFSLGSATRVRLFLRSKG